MNRIQDFDDISKLRICKKCKHVYLPEYKEERTCAGFEEFAVNDDLCVNCVEDVA